MLLLRTAQQRVRVAYDETGNNRDRYSQRSASTQVTVSIAATTLAHVLRGQTLR